jgi:hypothetical protein
MKGNAIASPSKVTDNNYEYAASKVTDNNYEYAVTGSFVSWFSAL